MANDLRVRSFVALGGSFTEDSTTAVPTARCADLLALGTTGFSYANLAVRGRMLDQIVVEQVPGGGCGFGRRARSGRRRRRGRCRRAGRRCRRCGRPDRTCSCSPASTWGTTPVLLLVRGKIAIYNEHLRTIAARHRLHLPADGHERVMRPVGQAMGVPARDPFEPWPGEVEPAGRRGYPQWAGEHFLPWVKRHLRGRSSGEASRRNVPSWT